jgi:hypothetical protein
MIRWTWRDKVTVIADVRKGGVPLADVLEAWGITPEEYAEWERAFDEHGREGLKATKLQKFRTAERRPRQLRKAAE